MRKLCKKYPQIKYYHNEINIGPDANFLKCILYAGGEYCLLLGDDDTVCPQTISRIISILSTKPDILILNGGGILNNLNTSIYEKKSGCLRFYDSLELLWEIGFLGGLISAVIFPAKKAKEIIRYDNDLSRFKELKYSFINMKCMESADNLLIDIYSDIEIGKNTGNYDPCEVFYETEMAYRLWREHFLNKIQKELCECIVKYYFASPVLDYIFYHKFNNRNFFDTFNFDFLQKALYLYPDISFLYKKMFDSKFNSFEDYQINKEQFYFKQMIKFCKSRDKIYVYGVGYYGEYIYNFMRLNNICISGGIVTVKNRSIPDMFHGLPVIDLVNMPEVSDGLGIVVSVKHEYQYRIIKSLYERGYEDNIFICYWLH